MTRSRPYRIKVPHCWRAAPRSCGAAAGELGFGAKVASEKLVSPRRSRCAAA